MQFIEKNSFNVRSAVYTLRKRGSGLEFLLFPMVHIGSRDYYSLVRDRLSKCDLILAEGVNSKRGRLLTYSYRVVRRIKRMDLATQQEALSLAGLKGKVVNADMSGQSFDKSWSRFPLRMRVSILLLLPAYIIYLLMFGTRDLIAEHMSLEDLPSRDEVLNEDETSIRLDGLLVDERDKILLDRITRLDEAAAGESKIVGVLFGAFHMRRVSALLRRQLGYTIVDSEWITVFDL